MPVLSRFIVPYIFIPFLVYFSGTPLHAQNPVVDSLKNELQSTRTDTSKLSVLFLLIENIEEDEVWSVYNNMAEPIAEKLSQDSHPAIRTKGLKALSEIINNKGFLAKRKGDINRALDYYSQAITMKEKLGDKQGTAAVLNNISFIYRSQDNYQQALDYSFSALALFREIHDDENAASVLNNIGLNYSDLGDFEKALYYYSESLEVGEGLHDERRMGNVLNNIGYAHFGLKEYDLAMEYYVKSLASNRKMQNRRGMCNTLNNISSVCFALQNNKLALAYSDSVFLLIGENVSLENILHAEKLRAELDSAQGNYPSSFLHYKRYILFRDSINNTAIQKKTIRIQLQYDFDKQATVDSIRIAEKKEQDDIKHSQEINQQKLYTYGGLGGFLLMLIVALVSFKAYRNKLKVNAIISHQKAMVEEKQKEILDSIRYAKRIQQSLLPSEKYISAILKSYID